MKALLVVDIQNDFCPQGTLGVPDGDKIIPRINLLLDKFPLILASKDWHPSKTDHFKKWPRHCVQNTKGAEYHPSFRAEKVEELFLKGTTNKDDGYSAFEATNLNLENVLKEKGVTDLYLTGLATDYCVKFTAQDAVKKGFQTYVITDAVAAVNIKPGDGEAALRELIGLGVHLLTSKDI